MISQVNLRQKKTIELSWMKELDFEIKRRREPLKSREMFCLPFYTSRMYGISISLEMLENKIHKYKIMYNP